MSAIDDIIAAGKQPSKATWDAFFAWLKTLSMDDLTLSDNTINDVSTSKHGHCPKLDGNPNHFLRSDGAQAAPPGVGGATGAVDGAIIVADGTTGDTIKTSLKTIAIALGEDNTTVPTSKAVQDALTVLLALKADLSSPALSGVPTAPTAPYGTKTTQIATMEALCNQFPLGLQPIGIEYDFTAAQPSPALRIIDINGNTLTSATAAALIALNPLFTGIKRCNLSNAGVVNAWWGDSGFSYTGSNGQCMTRYPRGYYREEVLIGTSTKKWRRWVCPIPWGGFRPHPAFMSNGIQNPEFYVGTFPASIYDSTTSTYLLDDEAYTSGDTNMLASIAGVGGVGAKPASGWHNAALTKTVFRTFAQNRGPGWNLWGFNQVAWIELLTYIKYGTFNLQATFPGVTNITDDGATNMAVRNGATAGYGGISGASDLGNTDGKVTIAHYQTAQATYPFNLLGLENPYGNIWQWVDYLKIHNNVPWIADYTPDDATTYPYSAPYVNSNLTLLASNDWTTQIARSAVMDYGFLPSVGGGSSASGLCDYYWQAAGDMAALFGGSWGGGLNCGPACWLLSRPASRVDRGVGGRVFFAETS